MTTRTIGIYKSKRHAVEAFEQLVREGFPRDSVSVLLSDTAEGRAFLEGDHSRVAQGALAGSAMGSAFAAIAAGALALPGVGIVVAGPIVAALGGAGIGAASGGILGALVGLGIPENEAALRSRDLQNGAVLVGVEVGDDAAPTAEELLATTGAAHVIRA